MHGLGNPWVKPLRCNQAQYYRGESRCSARPVVNHSVLYTNKLQHESGNVWAGCRTQPGLERFYAGVPLIVDATVHANYLHMQVHLRTRHHRFWPISTQYTGRAPHGTSVRARQGLPNCEQTWRGQAQAPKTATQLPRPAMPHHPACAQGGRPAGSPPPTHRPSLSCRAVKHCTCWGRYRPPCTQASMPVRCAPCKALPHNEASPGLRPPPRPTVSSAFGRSSAPQPQRGASLCSSALTAAQLPQPAAQHTALMG